jgi:uncharacterized protein (TIGR02246 family)
MKRIVLWTVGVALMMGSSLPVRAQAGLDTEFKKLVDAFVQAWDKGDAKGVAALHTTDAIRLNTDGTVAIGRAEIEKGMATAFAGAMKGARLVVTEGKRSQVTSDVYVAEGSYAVTGGAPAPPGMTNKGHYVNTVVRQSGRLLIASSAVQATMAAAK